MTFISGQANRDGVFIQPHVLLSACGFGSLTVAFCKAPCPCTVSRFVQSRAATTSHCASDENRWNCTEGNKNKTNWVVVEAY